MAHYTVKCEKCGSEFEIQLFGKMDKREWVIENGTHICDECQELERKERNAANAKRNAEQGLPKLTGSDKQIAWAETIRSKCSEKKAEDFTGFFFQEKLKSMMREGSITIEELQQFDSQCKTILKEAFDGMKQNASASWWINNRDDFQSPLAVGVFEKMKKILGK